MDMNEFKKKALTECLNLYNEYQNFKKYQAFSAFVESLKRPDNTSLIESIIKGTNTLMEGNLVQQYYGYITKAQKEGEIDERYEDSLRKYAVEYKNFGTRINKMGNESPVPTEKGIQIMLSEFVPAIYPNLIMKIDRSVYDPNQAEGVLTRMIEEIPNYVRQTPLKLFEPDLSAEDFATQNSKALYQWVKQFTQQVFSKADVESKISGTGALKGTAAERLKEQKDKLNTLIKEGKISKEEYDYQLNKLEHEFHSEQLQSGKSFKDVGGVASLDAPLKSGENTNLIDTIEGDLDYSDTDEYTELLKKVDATIDDMKLKDNQKAFAKEVLRNTSPLKNKDEPGYISMRDLQRKYDVSSSNSDIIKKKVMAALQVAFNPSLAD